MTESPIVDQPPERGIAALAPRGRGMTTPGRCSNLDYCSIGMRRLLVKVPVTAPFTCPECGGALRPPMSAKRAGRPWVMPLLRIMLLLVGIGLGFVQGYLTGRFQPAMTAAFFAASSDAARRLGLAGSGLVLPPKAASPAPAPEKLPVLVEARPLPARLRPADSVAAPHLADEKLFGRVVLDCAIDAISTHAGCRVSDVRGGDAFSPLAQAWLRSLDVRYAPEMRAGKPALTDHRWRVVVEDFSGTRARAGGK